MALRIDESASLFAPEMATIVKVRELSKLEKSFTIRFDSGRRLGQTPGQFVELSLFGIGEAPISVTSSPDDPDFELAVRRVGSVTGKLHTLSEGARVGIRGPFGHGFDLADMKGKDLLFVCAGIGLFPLRSLIRYVVQHRQDFGRVIIFFGAKTPGDMFYHEELDAWRSNPAIEYFETVDVPDASWKGNVGVITTLFKKISGINPMNTRVCIVGPPVMYKFAVRECQALKIPDDFIICSLERRMKCGVGKCGHCQINSSYVCQDGPVYKYSTIKYLSEAL
jgi:NAD(P)H-flavin reductase